MADFYVIQLKAGVEYQQGVSGKVILVDDIGQADGVDITPIVNGGNGRTMPNRKKAFKCWIDYDGVVLRADVDTTVRLFLSTKDVSLGFADGALVNVVGEVTVGNDPDKRIPVNIDGGTVNVTADKVGINNTNDLAIPVQMQALGTITTSAQAINTGPAQQVSADAALKRLRFRNASADKVIALGGATVTMATAAIALAPGDMWIEDDAAGAAWYAVADAAGADLRIMGVKA